MTNEISSSLALFIAEKILKQPARIIAPDQPLISSGLIDSFSLMDLALYIEDTELNVDTFDNLTQLASLIDSRKK